MLMDAANYWFGVFFLRFQLFLLELFCESKQGENV